MTDAPAFGEQQLAAGQFPRLAALYQQQSAPGQPANSATAADLLAAQFERGLTALLDGLDSG